MSYSSSSALKAQGDLTPITPMGSVTAIINPMNTSETLLFYCTDTYNLAVEHRALNQSAQSTEYTDNNVQNGNITQPGDFAVVRQNNVIQCYGVTNFTGGDGKVANVASGISPSINPIDQIVNTKGSPPSSPALTGTYSALAATTDGTFNDYVTFIGPNPANPALPQLIEYSININATSFQPYPTASVQILPQTRLAICYRTDDPNHNRFILGQMNSGGNPIGYMSTDEGAMNPIKGTNNASAGNPMAVTTAKNPEGQMNMYLFYMDNGNNLNKVIYNGTKKRWGDPNQVANNVQIGSGIAVVNDGTSCYAFYAKTGAKVFTMYTGPLDD
ncbi:hypothetical protein TWF694_005836 [Orbilia ellipsospora]|uniref:Fucose-specific lectin n=1 Tax=Orbilia ellipsospora TaxID=2528407 RepID=A0AAV9WS47_9PEZI